MARAKIVRVLLPPSAVRAERRRANRFEARWEESKARLAKAHAAHRKTKARLAEERAKHAETNAQLRRVEDELAETATKLSYAEGAIKQLHQDEERRNRTVLRDHPSTSSLVDHKGTGGSHRLPGSYGHGKRQ